MNTPARHVVVFICAFIAMGCQSVSSGTKRFPESASVKAPRVQSRDLFVFLDGTRNSSDASENATNVLRLFQKLKDRKSSTSLGYYIPGVGTETSLRFTGMTFGLGMQERILLGYTFLAEEYRPGDRIYIFGFSRGAHQARALAGLIAYAGLPDASKLQSKDLKWVANDILEATKDAKDSDHLESWMKWNSDQAPLLISHGVKHKKLIDAESRLKSDIPLVSAQVAFLGVWDTVPGSFFKTKKFFDTYEKSAYLNDHRRYCIENIDGRGSIANRFTKGERYKTGSYPPIGRIAHALSLDEKRSKFRPLLLCAPINEKLTTQSERWFPGAHADVGGGYENSVELPNISLAWMLRELNKAYPSLTNDEIDKWLEESTWKGDAKGLAHWSVDAWPANLGSDCEDRTKFKDFSMERKGGHASVDESYATRQQGTVCIKPDRKAKPVERSYPLNCSSNGHKSLPEAAESVSGKCTSASN